RERVFPPAPVAVGVDADVAALDAGAVHGAVHDELERRQHLALLADDAAGVGPGDDDVDVVAVRVGPLQPHMAVHAHLLDHVRGDRQGLPAALVGLESLALRPATARPSAPPAACRRALAALRDALGLVIVGVSGFLTRLSIRLAHAHTLPLPS